MRKKDQKRSQQNARLRNLRENSRRAGHARVLNGGTRKGHNYYR